LAKKKNKSADEIDLTPFSWITAGRVARIGKPGCGGCHPGGGGLEFDRNGNRYDRHLLDHPDLAASFDGDYYQSQWDKTGVIEADCLLCHLPGYNFKARNSELEKLNYKWAGVAGSGLGNITGSVKEGEKVSVVYNLRLFNSNGKIVPRISSPPNDENCLFCHGVADLLKRGFSWNEPANHDVHNLSGMGCVQCHPGNMEHNFAKGDEHVTTVRDDLDNTMLTCSQCHNTGIMGAPSPAHLSIRPSHLDAMACQVCHIPEVHRAASAGLDASTGKVLNYPRSGAPGLGQPFSWKPSYIRNETGKIMPVNLFRPAFYTNKDSDNIYYPLFAREISQAFSCIRDELDLVKGKPPRLTNNDQIRRMLMTLKQTLSENARFKRVEPFFHSKGDLLFLNDTNQLMVEPDTTWVAHGDPFNISHNIAPSRTALGASGCSDCHETSTHMYQAWISPQVFKFRDQPVSQLAGFMTLKNGTYEWLCIIYVTHRNSIATTLAGLIFMAMMLHYTGQGPKAMPLRTTTRGEVRRFNIVERWIHLFRALSFLLLFVTGYGFFYNKMALIQALFGDYKSGLFVHLVAGTVFAATSLLCLIAWAKDSLFQPYDRHWIRMLGGYMGHKNPNPPAGKLNAGQKIFFWVSGLFSFILFASGIMLFFRKHFDPAMVFSLQMVHGITALLLVVGIIIHVYLGTVANPGSYRAMVDGLVSRKWIQKHHPLWNIKKKP
jgi:formate dehydrogenase gamma subunit